MNQLPNNENNEVQKKIENNREDQAETKLEQKDRQQLGQRAEQNTVENDSDSEQKNKLAMSFENMYATLYHKYHAKFWWRRETLFVLVSILVAGLAAFLKSQDSLVREARLQEMYKTNRIYVASKEIKSGEILTDANMKLTRVLAANTTKNLIDESAFGLVEGRVLTVDVLAGDVIMLSAVHHKNAIRKMAQAVPQGKRLFTLSVEDESLQMGLIEPADRVDIIAHMNFPDKGPTSFTILEDVTLIAVGANSAFKRDDDAKVFATSVSFFVDLEKSKTLAFAKKHGTFSLSLRNKNDHAKHGETKGINHNNFLDSDLVSKASGGSDLIIKQK